MKKILVTGASGFIGNSICQTLSRSGRFVRGAVRSLNLISENSDIEYVQVGDFTLKRDWKDILQGIDCIVHCAGRAHKMKESDSNLSKLYQLTNVEVTRRLAEESIKAGIKRFVFLSSVAVLGIDTNDRLPFSNSDEPNPIKNYANSKLEAEKVLSKISNESDLEVVVLRIPLVYGPQAKGNLLRLIKLINLGIPLPFGTIKNYRSMIGLDNLVDVIIRCVDHPEAKGETFLVSDGEDLSTVKLINLIASSMGRSIYLFPLPLYLLNFVGRVLGKQKEIDRLVGSLQINDSYVRKKLNWIPPVSVAEGIRRMFVKTKILS
ncbi:NAD-dependent epimerase/dehydratase family protein [Candidatus Pelagibacter sp.]|nr:NAD-dependent epimerase/dehydratase family protein [Candidatus Pelagibacter sp.]